MSVRQQSEERTCAQLGAATESALHLELWKKGTFSAGRTRADNSTQSRPTVFDTALSDTSLLDKAEARRPLLTSERSLKFQAHSAVKFGGEPSEDKSEARQKEFQFFLEGADAMYLMQRCVCAAAAWRLAVLGASGWSCTTAGTCQ